MPFREVGGDAKTPAGPVSGAAGVRFGAYLLTGCCVTPMMSYGLVP